MHLNPYVYSYTYTCIYIEIHIYKYTYTYIQNPVYIHIYTHENFYLESRQHATCCIVRARTLTREHEHLERLPSRRQTTRFCAFAHTRYVVTGGLVCLCEALPQPHTHTLGTPCVYPHRFICTR